MGIDLADAAPENVPDGHNQNAELYGEGVKPVIYRGHPLGVRQVQVALGPRLEHADQTVANVGEGAVEITLRHLILPSILFIIVISVIIAVFITRWIFRRSFVIVIALILFVVQLLDEGVQRLLDHRVDPEGE